MIWPDDVESCTDPGLMTADQVADVGEPEEGKIRRRERRAVAAIADNDYRLLSRDDRGVAITSARIARPLQRRTQNVDRTGDDTEAFAVGTRSSIDDRRWIRTVQGVMKRDRLDALDSGSRFAEQVMNRGVLNSAVGDVDAVVDLETVEFEVELCAHPLVEFEVFRSQRKCGHQPPTTGKVLNGCVHDGATRLGSCQANMMCVDNDHVELLRELSPHACGWFDNRDNVDSCTDGVRRWVTDAEVKHRHGPARGHPQTVLLPSGSEIHKTLGWSLMQGFRQMGKATAFFAGTALVAIAVGSVVVARWRGDAAAPGPATRDGGADNFPNDGSNPFRTGHTLVIPHGGGDGLFPEDTLLAFERTMAMGADVVDVDLRLTRDGVVIAFHDPTVDRITGSTGSVRAMTFEQLSALDAGWSFTTAGSDPADVAAHPFRGKDVSIPTFESILDAFPTALISIDLKDEALDMVQPVCDLLRSHQRFNDVFVGSNSDPQIIEFRRQCPDVRTSAIMQDVYATRDARTSNDPNFVPAVAVDQPPFRINGRVLVDADSLAFAHRHGVAILTWVVNDIDDMRLLVDLAVDGIYTSYPDRLLKLLGRCTAECG
ncbi:hypothetical protein BH10ACT2_BH10ACT2_15630 [soil metagenome]